MIYEADSVRTYMDVRSGTLEECLAWVNVRAREIESEPNSGLLDIVITFCVDHEPGDCDVDATIYYRVEEGELE